MYLQNETSFTQSERNLVSAISLVGLTAPRQTGFVTGTLVETSLGWRAVETVMTGDAVQTYGGLRAVLRVRRGLVEPGNALTYPEGLLLVPGGALNNCSAFYLLPDQHLLLETIYAEEVFGDAATLVPAAALEGFRGITAVRPRGLIEVYTLVLAEEDVVFANTGVLFHCPSITDPQGALPASDNFLTLTFGQARALLGLLEAGAVSSDELLVAMDRAA